MAGVKKFLKQAQKMQEQMTKVQEQIASEVLEVSAGGGAIRIKITGDGVFQDLKLDPELLKEEAEIVEETLLEAVKEAGAKAKEFHEQEMGKITNSFSMPGLM